MSANPASLNCLAPKAVRTASSCSREADLASNKLARLAHPIRRIASTAQNNSQDADLASWNWRSLTERIFNFTSLRNWGGTNLRKSVSKGCNCASACAWLTPGLSRANTLNTAPVVLLRCAASSNFCGNRMSAAVRLGRAKLRGRTPATRKDFPSSEMERPATCVSPLNLLRHKEYVIRATPTAPGRSSSGVKSDPIIGLTPKVERKLASTRAQARRTGF